MKTIVMTGGTSGFGAVTVREFLQDGQTRVILGYRTRQIPGAVHIPLDLKNLTSVRTFTSEVKKTIGHERVHVLICNAGVTYSDITTRTSDGFETTFVVNHLAHYLLIRLLMPYLTENAKIILTTSGTHDPSEKTMVAAPVHANALWLAHPDADKTLDEKGMVNAGRAYSSSKLCNILTARYLNTTPEARSGNWKSIAYDPGPTPGTGLMQNGNMIMRLFWQALRIPALRKQALPKSNSRFQSGRTLADIALGNVSVPPGKVYTALRNGVLTFPDPSKLARSDDAMVKVWKDSEILLKPYLS